MSHLYLEDIQVPQVELDAEVAQVAPVEDKDEQLEYYESFERLLETPGYKNLEAQLKEYIEDLTAKLISAVDLETIRRYQERILAHREILHSVQQNAQQAAILRASKEDLAE